MASQVVLVVKNMPAHTGEVRDKGSILGSGRSPGGGHGNPFLPGESHGGAWWAIVHRVTKESNMTEVT